MTKEVCWNVTTRCNQGCKYCHRFLNIPDLSKQENEKILDNLIESGITEITWTGGEALMLDGIEDLLKRSKQNGIKNKLITNGKLLSISKIDELYPYLDSITLSIDSIDNIENEHLGRGKKHFASINEILSYLQKQHKNIKLRINTVANRYNLESIPTLIDYLNQFDIYSWRIFKFMPLREISVLNKNEFDITKEEYDNIIQYAKQNSKIKIIESRTTVDMQAKYLLILADGSIVITTPEGDKKIGNALQDSVINIQNEVNV